MIIALSLSRLRVAHFFGFTPLPRNNELGCRMAPFNMRPITRRRFVQFAASASVFAGVRGRADASGGKLRIGVTDWNLNLGADPEAVPLAAKLGFEGVQVSFGRKIANGKMPADDPATIERYLQLSRDHHIPIDGTCVDRLHDNGLKSDPQAVKWVHDSIRITKALGTQVLLLPFFGKWALQTQAEMDY